MQVRVFYFIFVHIKNKTMSKTLTKNDLANILRECASYVESEDNYTCNQFYFDEITNTGLFHDAIGKVIERDIKKVIIVTDY